MRNLTIVGAVLVGPRGKVFAFEPLPRNVHYLKEHLRLNAIKNVSVIEAAVSDSDGLAFFAEGQNNSTGQLAPAGLLRVKTVSLDEITSALDPELVGEVLSVVRQLANDGMTMIVVTHEMAFAREVSNIVVFMDGGRIVIKGEPDEILENPRHERLKTFLSRLDSGRRKQQAEQM